MSAGDADTKRVLVTGAAGFIGSALVRALVGRGYGNVAGVDIVLPPWDEDASGSSGSSGRPSGPVFHLCDVLDKGRLAQIVRAEAPDVIVHAAGRAGMRASERDPAGYHAANVFGTENVFEAARECGCRVVLISSGSVYGDVSTPAGEETPLPPPANTYIRTKMLAEDVARRYSDEFGRTATVLRVFTVYGPHQRAEMAIRTFVRRILAGEPVTVYGDGSARRDYLHINDCVEGVLRAVERQANTFEIVNVATGISFSLSEVLAILAGILGQPARVDHVPTPDGIPRVLMARIDKAAALYDYRPRVAFADGLRGFSAWFLRQREMSG
jgi:UDP-glucuronate 4-epimerase